VAKRVPLIVGVLEQTLSEDGHTASCVVFVTFRHGGCAYGVIGTKESFHTSVPTLPPPPPPSAPNHHRFSKAHQVQLRWWHMPW
jgi:hypothetical protein